MGANENIKSFSLNCAQIAEGLFLTSTKVIFNKCHHLLGIFSCIRKMI